MTISYREYMNEYWDNYKPRGWRDLWKRIVCELTHGDSKFVELGFNGVDEIWCTICQWRRRVYRVHMARPKEESFPEDENV
jgi:hypothetical protein